MSSSQPRSMAFRVSKLTSIAAVTLGSMGIGLAAAAGQTPQSVSQKVVLSLSVKNVPLGQNVVADVHKSTLASGTSLRHLTVNWGDGTPSVTLKSLKFTSLHRYSRTGSFRVKVTLTNSRNTVTTASVIETVALAQHVYWTLFNGTNSNYQLESAALPLSKNSSHLEFATTLANHFRCTAGATTDAKGRLWILSYPSGCSAPFPAELLVFTTPFTPTSSPVLTFSLPGVGDDDNMTFDSSGNLWIEDNANSAVYKFKGPFTKSSSLSPSLTLTQGIARPSGIAVDAKGNVVVANVTSTGTHSLTVFHAPVTNSSIPTYLNGLTSPGGLIFDRQGNLYASNNPATGASIVRYNVGHFANGATPSVSDHLGLSAGPYEANFAFDATGNLYDADCGAHASIVVYPLGLSAFSATLHPTVNYTNPSNLSIGCVWGIAIH
jgi:hypothetical protein